MNKKNNTKIFITILLTTIVVGTGTVFATNTYLAKDIIYTTSKNENIKTVNDALDDLYNKNDISKFKPLYAIKEADIVSLKTYSYTFEKKTKAILIANATHYQENTKYYHQLNNPIITNGNLIKIRESGVFNSKVTNQTIISGYVYIVEAEKNSTLSITANAYGFGNVDIAIIG